MVAATFITGPAFAQQSDLLEEEAELLETLDDEKKNELVVAPIPVVNPTFGTGLALLGMYLFQLDEGSQPSFVAAGGAYTNTGSYGFGVGQVAHFKDDAWKIKAGAVSFNLELEFYGIGRILGDLVMFIPYSQNGWGAGVQGLRRIKGNWYGGLQYWFVSLTTTFEKPEASDPDVLGFPVDSKVAGLGLIVEYDSRDNRFNPKKGRLFNVTWNDSNESLGSDFDFSSGSLEFNLYHELAPTRVIAGRGTLCMTPGDAPFYALCSFGQGVDLRGYVAGRYRDETMATIQAEYRWRFYKKWGAVAFAGVGEVADSWSHYNLENLLPSAGVGLRFKLSETTDFNLSVDYAVGKDSDAWYFYVGESF